MTKKLSEELTDLQKLKNLKHDESCIINPCEGGGCEVNRVNDVYVIFEIPRYGGEPQYYGTYLSHQLETILATAYSWT